MDAIGCAWQLMYLRVTEGCRERMVKGKCETDQRVRGGRRERGRMDDDDEGEDTDLESVT
jgi:hypothetical protein